MHAGLKAAGNLRLNFYNMLFLNLQTSFTQRALKIFGQINNVYNIMKQILLSNLQVPYCFRLAIAREA